MSVDFVLITPRHLFRIRPIVFGFLIWALCCGCVSKKQLSTVKSDLSQTRQQLNEESKRINDTRLDLSTTMEEKKKFAEEISDLRIQYNRLYEKILAITNVLSSMELDSAEMNRQFSYTFKPMQTEVQTLASEVQQLKEAKGGSSKSLAELKKTHDTDTEKLIIKIGRLEKRLTSLLEQQHRSDLKIGTPVDTVLFFSRNYGGIQMDTIADLTTANFRENRPKSLWVSEIWKALHKMGYKRTDSTIAGSKVKGKKAVVGMKVKIKTTSKESSQREIYHLILEKSEWLIDKLIVPEEEIDISDIEL